MYRTMVPPTCRLAVDSAVQASRSPWILTAQPHGQCSRRAEWFRGHNSCRAAAFRALQRTVDRNLDAIALCVMVAEDDRRAATSTLRTARRSSGISAVGTATLAAVGGVGGGSAVARGRSAAAPLAIGANT